MNLKVQNLLIPWGGTKPYLPSSPSRYTITLLRYGQSINSLQDYLRNQLTFLHSGRLS